MDFQTLVHERFSCRHYDPRPVEKEKLDRILEAARVAPTAKNLQPQRFLIVQSREGLEKMDGVTTDRFGAPVVVVSCYDKATARTTDYGYMTSDMDCTISLTHAMLAAEAEGLGSLWVLRFSPEKMKEAFSFPETLQPICLLLLGYKSEKAHPISLHHKSIPNEEMFFYEHF